MRDTASITVTADEANTILNALAARPFGEVSELVPRIVAECEAQFHPATVPADTGG